MLIEDTSLLGQTQRTLLFMTGQEACASAYLCWLPLVPSPAGAMQWAQVDTMPSVDLCYSKRTVSLGESTAFVASSKQACSLGVMNMFIILIVIIVALVYTYIKTHQTVHFKYLLFVVHQ